MPYWFIVTWKPWPRVSHPNLPSRVKSHTKRKNVKLGFLTFPIMADLLLLTKQILTRLLSCKCFRPRLARTWPTTAQTLSRITIIGDNITENPSLCNLGMIWKYVTEANSDTMSSRMIARYFNVFSRFFRDFYNFFFSVWTTWMEYLGIQCQRYQASKVTNRGRCRARRWQRQEKIQNWIGTRLLLLSKNVPNLMSIFTANWEIITTA